MSTLEERVSTLEEVQSDFVPPFKKMMVVLDQHTMKLDEQGVELRELSSTVGELNKFVHNQGQELNKFVHNQDRDMSEMVRRVSIMELRMSNMHERQEDFYKDMSLLKGGVSSIDDKLDQVLALVRPTKE